MPSYSKETTSLLDPEIFKNFYKVESNSIYKISESFEKVFKLISNFTDFKYDSKSQQKTKNI